MWLSAAAAVDDTLVPASGCVDDTALILAWTGAVSSTWLTACGLVEYAAPVPASGRADDMTGRTVSAVCSLLVAPPSSATALSNPSSFAVSGWMVPIPPIKARPLPLPPVGSFALGDVSRWSAALTSASTFGGST